MNNEELNKYIKHYLENNKTKNAIMLNAPWGTGKSHYIQNVLRDYLKKDDTDRCIIVSLYGMKDLSEISKSLYLEIRVKPIKEKISNKWNSITKRNSKTKNKHSSEMVATLVNGGKTILKGITGYHGIDLSSDDGSLQRLYESIDLTDKLIVLEDVERSEIDLMALMGYVNNLVEQDGVKVMLVANEDEILKKEPIEAETKEEEEKIEGYHKLGLDNRVYTEETKAYLKTKEKTISDTIKYEGNYSEAIQSIVRSFENEKLNAFLTEESIKELTEILRNKNLRSFIFACQKTVDIYSVLPDDSDSTFVKAIFFGIVIYSLRMKAGGTQKWDGDKNLSVSLGNSNYPLFKFCFTYIWEQTIDRGAIADAANSLKELRLYDRHQSRYDKDLDAIYTFYLQSELSLIQHLDNIKNRLETPDDISYYEYGKLASYVVALTEFIDYDITIIKSLIIKNLTGKGDKVSEYFLFYSSTKIDSPEKTQEYAELKQNMIQALKANQDLLWGFDYTPESIEKLYNAAIEYESDIRNNGKFVSLLDLDRFLPLLRKCTAIQLEEVRIAFSYVYYNRYIKNHFGEEKIIMESLLAGIKSLIQEENSLDRIQKLQLKWFSSNLTEYVQYLM